MHIGSEVIPAVIAHGDSESNREARRTDVDRFKSRATQRSDLRLGAATQVQHHKDRDAAEEYVLHRWIGSPS